MQGALDELPEDEGGSLDAAATQYALESKLIAAFKAEVVEERG